ncbi:MAG: hypothetical protein CME62_05135 [Halobacteriovoraceae bacterium]|nr:hypothetical protein [Halobacteriovoraceae bacterium]|tara:strand:- start:2954 stop:4033 length:1080 start_codon:yes stop_codon:yes gene_type:complete
MDFSLSSTDNIYLIPPYLIEKKEKFIHEWEKVYKSDHIFLFSSGTTSKKLTSYAISKEAFLTNAKAVNDFLHASSDDIWFNPLPVFHVGGFAIFARAHLLGAKVIIKQYKGWDVAKFYDELCASHASFTSLVPVQAHDLMTHKLTPPPSLKGVFIGGDFLNDHLAQKLHELNWPIIRTFGMTETCSQLATSFYQPDDQGFIKLLPIFDLKDNQVKSPSLYSAKIIFDKAVQVEYQEGQSFELKDELAMRRDDSGVAIKPLGRKDDALKIKGRLFYLSEIKNIIHSIFIEKGIYGQGEVFIDSQTANKSVTLLLEKSLKQREAELRKEIVEQVPPLSSVLLFNYLDRIDKTSLHKIKNIK